MVDELNTQPQQPAQNLQPTPNVALSEERLSKLLASTNLRDLIIEHEHLKNAYYGLIQANAEVAALNVDLQINSNRYELIRSILTAENEDMLDMCQLVIDEELKKAAPDGAEEVDITTDIIDGIVDALIVTHNKLTP